MKTRFLAATALSLCLALPMAAQAGGADDDIATEIREELADAREEVRVELAKARHELMTENLRIDQSLRFGRHDDDGEGDLPAAEITPAGDFLVGGEKQAIDAAQRRELLAYRKQVVGIALAGIAVGQEAADAALDAVGDSFFSIMFNALSGRLEQKVERVVEEKVQPMVLSICRGLPAVMASQQRLSASLPAFRPYANLDQQDIDDCEADMRRDFAAL